MSEWYYRVTADQKDLTPLVDCLEYFEKEYEMAKDEVKIQGSIEQAAARIPGIVEHRWSQLQEIEAILVWMDNQVKKAHQQAFKKFLEHYNRQLSSRDAQLYADADDQVLELKEILNQVSLIRNKYIGIMKALETKQYQINNITKLRAAGLEDTLIKF